MYRNKNSYYKPSDFLKSIPDFDRNNDYEEYKGPIKENFQIYSTINFEQTPVQEKKENIEMKCEGQFNLKTTNPNVWGPSFWFTLHNGASKYPVSATPIYIEKMKNFIIDKNDGNI